MSSVSQTFEQEASRVFCVCCSTCPATSSICREAKYQRLRQLDTRAAASTEERPPVRPKLRASCRPTTPTRRRRQCYLGKPPPPQIDPDKRRVDCCKRTNDRGVAVVRGTCSCLARLRPRAEGIVLVRRCLELYESTAIRPRYDPSTTNVTTGLLHCGLNK